jgi:hypothetical protein
MKKWLSRGIVLAMVIALMVPMPVAAKSGGKGKLVKSVTEYGLNDAETGWQATNKTTFTYDKKGYPKEIKEVTYNGWLFGVPVRGSVSEQRTFKYKYKGKNPKSSKEMNAAGVVMTQSSYKKGKPVSSTYSRAESWGDGTSYYGAEQYAATTTMSFDKNGLPTASTFMSNYQESGSTPSTYVETIGYAWAQKKGIPSLVYTTYSESSNGGAASTPEMYYTVFDSKGLAVESGYMENNVVPKAWYKFTYGMKKGKVDQAIVYHAETGKAFRMYEFKYNKTKISKTRYMSMINDLVGYSEGDFTWY